MRERFPPASQSKANVRTTEKVEARIWLCMLSLEAGIFARLNRALGSQCGLSVAKFDVLAQLDRFGEGLSLGKLSHNLKVTGSNVSGLVRRLSADGLITREMSSTDRRSFVVRLTPKGKAAFNIARRLHQKELSECFENVPASERQAALEALQSLSAHIGRRSAE